MSMDREKMQNREMDNREWRVHTLERRDKGMGRKRE